jgi:hypothetical protein
MGWKARAVDVTNRQGRRAGELVRSRPGAGTHPDWGALVHADQAYRNARARLFAGDPVPALRAALAHRRPAPPDRDIALRALSERDPPTDVVAALVPELFAWALDPELSWSAQVRTVLCRLDRATRAAALTPLVRDFLAARPADADAVAGLLTLLHQARLPRLFGPVHQAAGRSPYPDVRQVAEHWDHIGAAWLNNP